MSDVNAKDNDGDTPLSYAKGETADLLRKHGGKTGEELKAEGKMKHLQLTTIAAVVLVGCEPTQQSVPAPEATPQLPPHPAP